MENRLANTSDKNKVKNMKRRLKNKLKKEDISIKKLCFRVQTIK